MILHVCQCSGCRLASSHYPNTSAFPGLPWTIGPNGHLVVSKRVLLRLHDDKVPNDDGPTSSVCILGQRISSSSPAYRSMTEIKGLVESYMERYT